MWTISHISRRIILAVDPSPSFLLDALKLVDTIRLVSRTEKYNPEDVCLKCLTEGIEFTSNQIEFMKPITAFYLMFFIKLSSDIPLKEGEIINIKFEFVTKNTVLMTFNEDFEIRDILVSPENGTYCWNPINGGPQYEYNPIMSKPMKTDYKLEYNQARSEYKPNRNPVKLEYRR